MFKLTSWGLPKDVMLQVSLLDVFRTFIGRFSKLNEYAITNFLGSNTHIWWSKTESITTEMHFVLNFKLTSWGKPDNVTRRASLWDLYLQDDSPKTQNYKIVNSLVIQVFIWLNKIENNAVKMHLYNRFKNDILVTSKGRHLTDVFSELFEDVRRNFHLNFKNKL